VFPDINGMITVSNIACWIILFNQIFVLGFAGMIFVLGFAGFPGTAGSWDLFLISFLMKPVFR